MIDAANKKDFYENQSRFHEKVKSESKYDKNEKHDIVPDPSSPAENHQMANESSIDPNLLAYLHSGNNQEDWKNAQQTI